MAKSQSSSSKSSVIVPMPAAAGGVNPVIQCPRTGDIVGMTFLAFGTAPAGSSFKLTLCFSDPEPGGTTYGPYPVTADASGNWSLEITVNETHERTGSITLTGGTTTDTVSELTVSDDPEVTIESAKPIATASTSGIHVMGYAAKSGSRFRYALLSLESLDKTDPDGLPIACLYAFPNATTRLFDVTFPAVTHSRVLLRALWVTRRDLVLSTSTVVDMTVI